MFIKRPSKDKLLGPVSVSNLCISDYSYRLLNFIIDTFGDTVHSIKFTKELGVSNNLRQYLGEDAIVWSLLDKHNK